MTTNVITIDVSANVSHAIRLMIDNRISGLPVVDEFGCVCGMVTEGDLLARCENVPSSRVPDDPELPVCDVRQYIKINAWRIGDVMTPNIVAVTPDAPVSIVAKLMAVHNIKRILVLAHGHLVGLVSRHDLLRAIASTKPDIVATGDDALRLAIATRLKAELGLADDRIDVAVRNSQVSITGNIDSELQRQAVRVLIERINGTNGFVDGLHVASKTA